MNGFQGPPDLSGMSFDDDTSDRTWRIELPFVATFESLEDIADGIDEGEILPGAFVLRLPAELYDRLPPELVRRLGAFISRHAVGGGT